MKVTVLCVWLDQYNTVKRIAQLGMSQLFLIRPNTTWSSALPSWDILDHFPLDPMQLYVLPVWDFLYYILINPIQYGQTHCAFGIC